MKKYIILYILFFCISCFSQYNHQKSWCSYYFGNSSFFSKSIVDNEGNIIIVGKVSKTNYFDTSGTYNNLNQSLDYYSTFTSLGSFKPLIISNVNNLIFPDGFVAKFNQFGQLIWATYFGCDYYDTIYDLQVDNLNNIFFIGYSIGNLDVTTAGSFISTVPGNFDTKRFGYLTKFSSTGQQLWGTYIYGAVNSITINSNNELFIAGITYHNNNVTTSGAYQENLLLFSGNPQNIYSSTYYSNDNGFIMKFDGDGNRLAGTYIGKCFLPKDITTDSAGNVIVVGYTYNEFQLASSANVQQTNFGGGETDGVIMKFTPSLSGKFWSTYFGGNINDEVTSVKTIGTSIYITGNSNSTDNLLTTTGVYQSANAGSYDGFIAKFNQFGYRQWCSYYGGENRDFIDNLEINNGKLYVSGNTKSTTGIATTSVYQEINNSANDVDIENADGFFGEFTTSGQRNWASYFGGEKNDYCQMIFSPTLNGFYITGSTASETSIATAGSLQENLSIGILNPETQIGPPTNIFIAKFDALPLSNSEFSLNSFSISPNPNNGKFVLKSSSKLSEKLELRLYDVQSRLIQTKIIENTENQEVDFSNDLKSGIYIVTVFNGGNSISFKMVVK